MKAGNQHIVAFEYEHLSTKNGRINETQLQTLQSFYGEKGVPYYSLTHHGIKLSSFVGVIQTASITLEILPKTDRYSEEELWRERLISMLRATGAINIHTPSSSSLNLQHNSILDLYFEIFISQLEYLINQGLVKQYRREEGNKNTLKGSLHFAKNIKYNLVNKERFYVKNTTYDTQHQIHCILYKALKLLSSINQNQQLSGRIGSMLLQFPEMPYVSVSETQFNRISLTRKTEHYRTSLDIAKLLLLNYHPDLTRGSNNVLALLFDMNLLWESFVCASISKFKKPEIELKRQYSKKFWTSKESNKSTGLRPDIVLRNKRNKQITVLDTKWKNIGNSNPSVEDLRQMYVYLNYFQAQKVALIYPSDVNQITNGVYYDEMHPDTLGAKSCALIKIAQNRNVVEWQKSISNQVITWSNSN